MQILFTFKNVDSSNYLKSYLEEKLQRLDKIMYHPGTADVVFQSEKLRKIVDVNLSSKGIDIHAREILKIRDKLNEILAQHTGTDIERIREDTERDFFMDSQQAKEYGIIDKVIHKREMRDPSNKEK